jgi:diaminopimelate epimerase
MAGVAFTKMHGLGNHYVYVNGFEERVADPPALARAVSDPYVGIGADGLILILPPPEGVDAQVAMRIFNADGSEAEMCGNGIRCVCKYVHDHGLARSRPLRVATGAGVLSLDYTLVDDRVDEVTVDMGEPTLDLVAIGVDAAQLAPTEPGRWRIDAGGRELEGIFVSMGNPHAVIVGAGVGPGDLAALGPRIEHHPAFPNRINAHFVVVDAPDEVTMLTWERGSGATRACGTGAAAVCVATASVGLTGRAIRAHLPGGELRLRWNETTNHVHMTGPACEVFTGVWPG